MWIKCSDRMPDKFQEVLMCCLVDGVKKDLMTGFLDRENDWEATYLVYGASRLNYNVVVTHWQPLPDYPADE